MKKKEAVKKEQGKKSRVRKKIIFQLRFSTVFGEELFVTGNHPQLGNNNIAKALPLEYVNNEFWRATLLLDELVQPHEEIVYNYVLKNTAGLTSFDWGTDRRFSAAALTARETVFMDAWNHAGFTENVFYSAAFTDVLFSQRHTVTAPKDPRRTTHRFHVKAPLTGENETLCLLGSTPELGAWDTAQCVPMHINPRSSVYEAALDLSEAEFPVAYKYGVCTIDTHHFIRFEDGDNRLLSDAAAKGRQVIVNDCFARFPATGWRGAGVSLPVFSLRSEQGFGIGEFTDLKLLADWAATAGLNLIQILPVNDTTAFSDRRDSYPYAAISAFALHPAYMNLAKLAGPKHKALLGAAEPERKELNGYAAVDYEKVIALKIRLMRQIYEADGQAFIKQKAYRAFTAEHAHWLYPYAAFCYLRDLYGTPDHTSWPEYAAYDEKAVEALLKTHEKELGFYCFVQYHLHLQLSDTVAHVRSKQVVLKGDIAIGVYRYGADTWQYPALFNMDMQAGAPPDDFAVKGQNWGFPTYNWAAMRNDGFAWWKKRFGQMRHYFDAFRIDHILGFFRIWSIPMHAVEGIMGHFVPAIPVHINELNKANIGFSYHRYTRPFITDDIITAIFKADEAFVKETFLHRDEDGTWQLKPAFATQRQVEEWFAKKENQALNTEIRNGLYNLISNVIFLDAGDGSLHFRFAMEATSSFSHLEMRTQLFLRELYIDYFFRRQEDSWRREALQKLPELKRGTRMLVCGEDLGLVPACVPDVMRETGLLSLEIQRMPKDPGRRFFHPDDAPYLSVVTPSTHDMSTIRGWWEEELGRERQLFYELELGQWGDAPATCNTAISKAIILQHLYSPAMWSIFQLQDLMGMNEELRNPDVAAERINIPADPQHYWRYRMHLTLETLLRSDLFCKELRQCIEAGGRLH
ncbi:4-alpha-glucanotransferase [Sediminibacterium ginsengisoli]|uniref:4-alpha-glucanotransferase n=1 Tax=Sediminibacterium ginsengisoli TaxID=413434 RepID=A0A1T4RAI4_9BACT|nr:4-alpha-glucanotransferase [Sediminibacterium ginsengisoli]SKA12973.1 4-alpha-glucanotransferase [Sediminibacterium ginsengisoli]